MKITPAATVSIKNLIRRLPRGNILSNAPIERSPMP